ncbi:MAG: AzlC family ABC transporter permease [Pseudomonadota bacterium]
MVRNPSPQPDHRAPPISGAGVLRGMRRLFPVSLFVVAFGIAFGVAAVEHGLSPLQAVIMSALVFTATAQFAALDFLSEPIAFLSLALVVLSLSSRHIVLGAALAKTVYRLPLMHRFAVLSLLSDANFADAQSGQKPGEADAAALLGGGLMLWLAWVSSTAIGAFGGDTVVDPEAAGFGAVMICFFAATVVGRLRTSPDLALAVVLAATISALTQPWLPMGWNILLAACVGGYIATWSKHD